MKRRLPILIALLITFVASAYVSQSYGEQAIRVPTAYSSQPGAGQSIASMLNPDGTLRQGIQGSFDTSGFKMEMTPAGAPRFAMDPGCETWSTLYAQGNGANGAVRSLIAVGNDLYVGGAFTLIGGIVPANRVAKYNITTGTWSTLGTGGGNGVNGDVTAMVMIGSNLYLGGNFTLANVGGATVSPFFVARFDTLTGAWSTLGGGINTGVNTSVNALAAIGNDLYIGGAFTAVIIGGFPTITANRIVKFDTITSKWSSLGSGGGNGVNGPVFALAINGADMYVGGSFGTSNLGAAVPVTANRIARLDTTTGTWSKVGSAGGNGTNGNVNALVFIGSDLYVGGSFFSVDVGATITANFIARFDTLNNMWSPMGAGGGNGVNDTVSALTTDGTYLYVGGGFEIANIIAGALTANRVARFDPGTSTWSSLGSGGNGVLGFSVQALLASGGKLYVGGFFSEANVGAPVAANNLAMFDTGTSDWSGFGMVYGAGVNGNVFALAAVGNYLYVGGSFTSAGGVAANNIARFDTVTKTWSALGSGGGNGVRGTVNALIAIGGNLYVGGAFSAVNIGLLLTPVPTFNIARFDMLADSWSSLGSGVGNGVNSSVSALAAIGSDLYVGGNFSSVNVGAPITANRVAKYDTITGTWSVLGSGSNGVSGGVTALAVIGNNLYVGGFFSTANVGGPTVAVSNIAKYDTTTGTWSSLGSGGNGVNSNVLAMAAIGDDLYVGGFFSIANVGGVTVPVNRIAKFDTGTSAWSALGSGGGNGVTGSNIRAITVVGSDLYVSGIFTEANSGAPVPASNIAKFDTTTSTWSALPDAWGGDGLNGTVFALQAIDKELFAGGAFSLAGVSKISSNIGSYCLNTPPAIGSLPVVRVQGAFGNSLIATVFDAEDDLNTLNVTATLLNGSGVTVSGFAVDGAGKVTADISATCLATTSTFTLEVSDSQNAVATDTLTVTVNPNPAPVLSYADQTVVAGNSLTVNPVTGPSDNGSIATIIVQSVSPPLTTMPTVDGSGVVTITDAGPAGLHTITILATDDCGQTTLASFTLDVKTTEQATQSLISQVSTLAPLLTSKQADKLIKHLDKAFKEMNKGKPGKSCGDLQNFINLVTDYISQGILTPAQGQPLIDAATDIRTALGCT